MYKLVKCVKMSQLKERYLHKPCANTMQTYAIIYYTIQNTLFLQTILNFYKM